MTTLPFIASFFSGWKRTDFLLFFLACILLLPQSIIIPPGTFVDFGYQEAINYIVQHRMPLTFGRDVAYTYGPLGFLCYKVASSFPLMLAVFLFELYIYFNALLIVRAFMPVKSILAFLAILITLLLFNKIFKELTYYPVFLFSAFTFLRNGNLKYLINALFIGVLAFFIKANIGLIMLFSLFAVLLFSFFKNKQQRKMLAFFATLSTLFMGLLACWFGVNILDYITTSINIIGGYNETMVVPIPFLNKWVIFEFIVMIIYNLLSCYYVYKRNFQIRYILTYLMTSLYLFVVVKYSLTRAYASFINIVFLFIETAVIIQYLFEEGGYRRRLRDIAIVNLFLVGGSFFVNGPELDRAEISKYFSVEFFKDLTGGVAKKYNFSEDVKIGRIIPQKILNRIGEANVDLMSFNTSIVFINHLNYNPRPTIQSFVAMTPFLDSLNCKKYISDQGPEFVLFALAGVDDRAPFWDEPATKRAVCQYYHIVDSFYVNDSYINGYNRNDGWILPKFENQKYLLMERRQLPLKAIVTKQDEGMWPYGKPLNMDTGLIPQYIYVDFEYTLIGKIKKLLFQPTLVYANIIYEDGKHDIFRACVPIMKSGVLINKKVTNSSEAETFFKTNGTDNQRVKSITFVAMDKFSFKKEFKYRTELISYSK